MTLLTIPIGTRSAEFVFPMRYFDLCSFGGPSLPNVGLLFDGPLSESIANPFEGSDIVVSASVCLPNFRIFTDFVDQNSPVGRMADIGITVGAEDATNRSWPISGYTTFTPDRGPYMPDPLNANPTNGMGGYTVSEALEVVASGPTVDVFFQDELTTDPVLGWELFGYRAPAFGEDPLSHARLHVTIQEQPA